MPPAALAHGHGNVCGMFVAIVRRHLWAFLNCQDEEHARKSLAQQLGGSELPAGMASAAASTRGVSRISDEVAKILAAYGRSSGTAESCCAK